VAGCPINAVGSMSRALPVGVKFAAILALAT
jgi:hypothetical protein